MASTASQNPTKSSPPPSTTSETSSKPVWCTGPKQVQVELLFGGEYDVDLDIATRMGIAQDGVDVESPVTVTGCSARDFESALVFCANDRDCQQPPSKELSHIINEMAPSSTGARSTSPRPSSKQATPGISQRLANVQLDDDEESDEEDASYQPSSDSEASDSGDEYSDTDLADVGTDAIKAEREEVKAKEKEGRLMGLE
ncbi:hypothetical protein BDV93DRAFT_547677 [Ceratobasidium sp. AG-I]|nr:hypothetical protein BDV93DRAFT_547677 [Ceratobasidium sp. AG-I]